jgi:hypothetical protein
MTDSINNDLEYNVGFFNYKNSYYPSNIEGQRIVDAVTGAEYPWRVGSYEEKRFFKVMDASDIMESNGKRSYNKRNPNFLYYQSPESYMKYKNVVLEESVITDWYNKYILLFPNHVFDHKAYKILYS